MTDTPEPPAPTRDEILQTHLVAIREEIRALPWRTAWAFAGVMVLLTVAGYALWFVLLMASP